MVLAECDQRGEPGSGRGNEQFGEAAAKSVEQNRDVFVLVGVDADDGIVAQLAPLVEPH